MSERLSLNLRQLTAVIVFIILFTAVLSLTIFWLGQQSVLRMENGEEESASDLTSVRPPPTLSPQNTLPRAMTATPKMKSEQQFTLTEEQATQLVLDQIQQTTSGAVFKVDDVAITREEVIISGFIDYMGYSGPLDIEGVPVVELARLHFKLDSAKLDGQELPPFMVTMIEEQIDDIFDKALIGYDVKTVKLEDGVLILTILPW